MVTTEVAQLSRECNAWRETLRSYRDQFSHLKSRLQDVAGRHLNKEDLTSVEHFDNQFHIQLINIHDLKQAIKIHDRRIASEMAGNKGHLQDETLADHENLYDEYQRLEHTLQDVQQDFTDFVSTVQ